MRRHAAATLLLSLLILGGCSGTRAECTEKTKIDAIEFCLAEGWERITNEMLKEKGVPEETIAAFHQAGDLDEGRDNLVISREKLPGHAPSLAFAEANVKSVQNAPEYVVTEMRTVKLHGDPTLLHIFTAKPSADIPARRFYQLSLTQGVMGYTLTGTLPFSVNDEQETALIAMLMSVEFTEEQSEE